MEGWPASCGTVSEEAEALLMMEKVVDGPRRSFQAPTRGKKLEVGLTSVDGQARFVFSLFEGKRSSSVIVSASMDRKTSMHTRKGSMTLARIDLDEHAVHTNPDGEIVSGNHVHVWTSEYGDKYAIPLSKQSLMPAIIGTECSSPEEVFEAFKDFCHIEKPFVINWNLGV